MVEILKRKSFSDHPDDDYLEVVLAKRDSKFHPFVTWEHNKADGGYFLGHYFTNIEDAKNDFMVRGV